MSWISLLTPFTRDDDFFVTGSGVPVGEGLATVTVADECSEVVGGGDSMVDTLEKSSSRPSALTTAETRIAGAGAAVPGSFQKLPLVKPELERV